MARQDVLQALDSLTSYTLAFFILAFTAILDNASGIMTIGGMVLLGLRLYVDWTKARTTYQEHKDWKEHRNDRKGS